MENEGYDKEQEYREYYRNRIWKGRDFEITHFWIRTAFLATFLVILYTGYGSIIGKLFFPENSKVVELSLLQNLIAIGIAFFGYIISLLWIMMAKGSKYWYEIYEMKIKEHEKSSFHNHSFKAFEYKKYDEKIKNKKESLFFNINAYRYSVSGIAIVLGQLFALSWGLIIFIHVYMEFLSERFSIVEWFRKMFEKCPLGILLLVLIIVPYILQKHLTSKS